MNFRPKVNTSTSSSGIAGSTELLLDARGLYVRYGDHAALREVSLQLQRGEWLSIVGESGSGKSTLLRSLALLQDLDAGELWLEGRRVSPLPRSMRKSFRESVQLVMQDAAMALNPTWTAVDLVAEPLELLHPESSRSNREQMALESIAAVGLPPWMAHRRSVQCSGGQRQRLQLARALVLRPRLLLLDEPFTGLDLPVQRDLLELLAGLRQDEGLTCVLVTHDLELAWSVSTRIAVLEDGTLIDPIPVSKRYPTPDFDALAERHTRLAAMLAALATDPEFLQHPISTPPSGAPQ